MEGPPTRRAASTRGDGPVRSLSVRSLTVRPLSNVDLTIATVDADADAPDDPARARRLDWATLMKRAYALDVLVCPKCHGSMGIIGLIDDEEAAVQILDQLGLSSRAPPRGHPWRPGQQPLAFDDAAHYDGVDPLNPTD